MPELEQLRPTLVVGVGGIGCWLADRVYAMGEAAGIPRTGRISILGFDTDQNDIVRLKHLGPDQLVRTSTADSVFTVLGRHGDRLEDWFVDEDQLVTEIRQMVLLDGAGQIRMLSRMAFDVAMQDVRIRTKIENALGSIATHDNQTQFEGKLNVLILGSLAGGTGSGMFLQTALLLGAMIRARGITPEIRGLFLLPDILTRAARIAAEQVLPVRANGYAALKELYAVGMQTRARSDRPVRFDYVMDQGLSPDGVPFVSVVLMDYEDQSGGNLGRALEAYRGQAATAAYTLLFTPIGGTFNSHAINDVRKRLAAAAAGDDNSIAGIGLASVVYPEEGMLEYLSLCYGASMLDGEWLRLDEIFRADQDRYRARVNNGETNLKPPRRGESFVRNLEYLAVKERIRFFREIHDAVYRKTEDSKGNEHVDTRFETYLDALERHLLDGFWISSAKLKEARGREDLGADSLTDRDGLAQDVRLYERHLKNDFREIERALEMNVGDLFNNAVIGAMYLGENEWKPHHIEPYLLLDGPAVEDADTDQGKVPPHLVQVRYFLYKLRDLIGARTTELEDKDKLRAIEATLKEAFDDPKTEQIESAIDIAIQRAASAMPELLDRRFRQFARNYRDHYNSLLVMLRDYANDGAKRRLYSLLDHYVARMLEVIERFFDELADLKNSLALERNQLEIAHVNEIGAFDGNRYVFADREAKQRLWDELRRRIEGASAGAQEANAALTRALIERFRDESRTREWEILEPFSGNTLFREQVIETFCRDTIASDYASVYRLTAVEAMRREARSAEGSEEMGWIKRTLDLVASQSSPLLALSHPKAGQDYRFWALSPANEKQVGSPGQFEDLFANARGDQRLVEDEFPDHTLTCLSLRVNLRLSDLRKLEPGLKGNTNVAAPQPGIYYQAYRQLVDAALRHERESPGTPNPHFTPHLDKRWHRPGVLPEIHPEIQAQQEQARFDAYVAGIALDLLAWEERGGRPVTVYRDYSRRGAADYERVLMALQDDLAVLEQLRAEPAVVESILDRLRALVETVGRPGEADPLYEGLTRAGTLARICRLLEDRTRAELAGTHAAQALATLFRILHEVSERRYRHLDAAERLGAMEQAAEILIRDAELELARVLRADTLKQGLRMARGQLKNRLDSSAADV